MYTVRLPQPASAGRVHPIGELGILLLLLLLIPPGSIAFVIAPHRGGCVLPAWYVLKFC